MTQTIQTQTSENSGAARTYEVRTFGCQMNVHDSERLSGLLEDCLLYTSDAADE